MRQLLTVFLALSLAACGRCGGCGSDPVAPLPPHPTASSGAEPASMPSVAGEPGTPEFARPESEWIAERVAAARERLDASRGGQVVAGAIDAAGGLERWYANGPIQFRFRYAPIAGRPPIDTVQIVDTWRSRATHELTEDRTIRFGWDGERAWTQTNGAELGTNARFWALTPYYFIGVPFVLADPGVNLAHEGELDLEGRTWEMIRATFDDGTGDAPDDYYVVLVDKETRRVGGVRYIVTYPGFFPNGGSTDEKVMFYDGEQVVDGIRLPETFRTHRWVVTGEPGFEVPGPEETLLTESSLSDVEFLPGLSFDAFEVPEGAAVQERW